MKKISGLLTILIILAVLILPLFVFENVHAVLMLPDYQPDNNSYSAGSVNMTILCTAAIGETSAYGLWTTVTHQDSADSNVGGVGYIASTTSQFYRTVSQIMGFNLTGAPDISQINYIKVRLYCSQTSTYNAPTFDPPLVSLYDTSGGTNDILDSDDIDQFNDGQVKKRMSNYLAFSYFTALNWTTFTIKESAWQTLLTSDNGTHTYLDLVTEQHALDNAPLGYWKSDAGYNLAIVGISGGNTAQLIINYVPVATTPVFTYITNNSTFTATLGDETADNITLSTLSCMYANEDLQFDVSGDAGANITLQMVDSNGSVLESLNDSVRVGGHYYWRIDSLADNYQGIIQVKESIFNLSSPWVWIEPKPDDTEANMCTYASTTDYPQYTTPFSSYVVNTGQYMVVHWKTNINTAVDDLNTTTLGIYDNGDSVYYKYLSTFTNLRTYFQGTTVNQNAGLPWRFMIFTPKALSSTNQYGGLVINLGIDFVPEYKGFLQSMIANSTGELTTTHSAYWYIPTAADGIAISMVKSVFKPDETIDFIVSIGKQSNVDTNLQYMTAQVIETGGSVSSSVENGDNSFSLDSITTDGDYTLQVTLYNTDKTSYQYIYQLPFEISVSGVSVITTTEPTSENILKWLTDTLKNLGLDSTLGHWIVILFLMALSIILGIKSKSDIMINVLPLLILAIAIVIGWIDIWAIVLLAGGVGLNIFKFFRKKAAGGDSQG